MKLNQFPNFRTEDFPSEQAWIGKMFIQINPFIQSVNQVFDNNIDFSSNIKTVTRTYSISAFQAFGFVWPYTNVDPVDLRICKATKGAQLTPTILLAAWSFDSSTKQVSVSSMLEALSTGVAELSGSYQFTVRVNV